MSAKVENCVFYISRMYEFLHRLGLGCAKTPVEISLINCISESQNILHTTRFDALLENCVFYILWMWEFLHSQGQERRIGPDRNISASTLMSGRSNGHVLTSAWCHWRSLEEGVARATALVALFASRKGSDSLRLATVLPKLPRGERHDR
jgi:hypothetical protein